MAVTSILRVLAVPAVGAGYYEDLAALQASPVPLSQRFTAAPVTHGFHAIREIAEAVSIGLELDTPSPGSGRRGQVVWGDCVAVAYSGKAGRDPVFRTEEGLEAIQRAVAPALHGRKLTSFRELAAEVDTLTESVMVPAASSACPVQCGHGEAVHRRPAPHPEPIGQAGVSRRAILTAPVRVFQAAREEEEVLREQGSVERPLHTAIRYGVSQALLQAVALAQGMTMAEVIAQEWGLPLPDTAVPVHAQSGSERYHNAEKMIAHRIASLPHALVDDVASQVGKDGSELTHYIRWLVERIGQLGGENYHPTLHLDLHGALGQIYQENLGRMLGQLYAWELAAQPYPLRIESPMVLDSREAQIEAMKTLRDYVRFRKMKVQLVADEWANTLSDIRAFVDAGAADMIQIKMPDLGGIHHAVEAVLACKAASVGAFLGGSYAETELSARVSVHVALATRADLLMAKPGVGVDEAISLVQNEMARTLALVMSPAP